MTIALKIVAASLKSSFSPSTVRSIADDLRAAWPAFPHRRFVSRATAGLDQLELMARAQQVCDTFDEVLPTMYREALAVLVASFGRPLDGTGPFGMSVFRYLPHSQWIARHGPKHPKHLTASLAAIHALTQRFTGEFAIRVFIEQHFDRTISALNKWSTDRSVHVRRLVSEGTRPRLPWAGRLRCFQADPAPTIALLDRLVDDDERYVQRSVANHLGDIAKDHPELATSVAKRWLSTPTPGRQWIVQHGLRFLLKCGDRAALALMGHAAAPRVNLTKIKITPQTARIGRTVNIACQLSSTARQAQSLRIDLRIHYCKQSGPPKAKTFRVANITLLSQQDFEINQAVSFKDLSTRTHFPGPHRCELVINGHIYEIGTCVLRR